MMGNSFATIGAGGSPRSVDLEDLENCARLISAYVKTLDADSDFIR